MFIDWANIFTSQDEVHAGASLEQIREAENEVRKSLLAEEINEVNASQLNPYPVTHALQSSYKPFDPATWRLPQICFPTSFVELLMWSNGGVFSNDQIGFLPLFRTDELRGYMLNYYFPQFAPDVMPFAMDGGGAFYAFNARQGPDKHGEYPVVMLDAGALDMDDAQLVGITLRDACISD